MVKARLSVMMFLQWAMFGLWIPVIAGFLKAEVGDGGMGFDEADGGPQTDTCSAESEVNCEP